MNQKTIKMIKKGLLLYNKRIDFTSNDELSVLKKALNIKSCGHSGTLDKNACGLMLIFIGDSTKFSRFFIGLDKRYIAEIEFGEQRSTDDANGEVINNYEGPIDFEIIKKRLIEFNGKIIQTPPDYSSVHVNGKRAYKIAKSGIKPEIKSREVEIKDLKIIDFNDKCLKIDVSCSSGTYIRSIARDIGIKTGYFAYLNKLERIEIGNFSINDSYKFDQIKTGNFNLLNPEDYIPDCTTINISDLNLLKLLSNGVNLKNIDNFILNHDNYRDGLYKLFYNKYFITVIEKQNKTLKYIIVNNEIRSIYENI